MSLARGKFGIEYDPRHLEPEPSGFGWLVVAVAVVAFVSFAWTLVARLRSYAADVPPPAPVEDAARTNAAPTAVDVLPLAPAVQETDHSRRPVKVRNLLMRLGEAERLGDAELAVSTIETIRSLPGSPAADLDDALARRLGVLNVRRLLKLKNAQWVRQVTVGRGGSASRIAAENGSTLASLVALNGNVDRLIVGQKLHVMDHPRFNLVIHRRSRTADLSLNGKFFKRYDLQDDVKAKEGAYELPEKKRAFWANVGLILKPADRAELEMLLPVKTSVLISEM